MDERDRENEKSKATEKGIRGGLSAYIESLMKADLKKDGLTFNDK